MDFMTAEVVYGVAAAGVAGAVLVVASIFASRETTFEEAVLKNRKKDPILQELLSSSKPNKNKSSDQKKKTNNANNKTSKKRSSVGRSPSRTVPVVSVEPPSCQTSVVETQEITDRVDGAAVIESLVLDSNASTATPKHEGHVEFKVVNEIVSLDEEMEEQLFKRKIEENKKPRKPILTNKGEAKKSGKEDGSLEQLVNKPSRGNSFETVHPKDDYELMKSKDPSSPNARSPAKQFNGFPAEGETTSAPVVVGDIKKKDKKSKPITKQFSQDLFEGMSPAKLIEVVKSLALNDQEVQLLVNELLNRDSNGETSWSSKSDPTTALKKSLTEAESLLKTEKSNLESTLIRVKELREELAAEKKMTIASQQHSRRLDQELAKSSAYILQLKNEVNALNANFQSKKSEEVAALNRLQDENRRLKDIISKFESERQSLEAIPRLKQELEQLRTERHQTNAALKQLTEENHALKDHVQSLSNSRQHEEHALRQQLADLSQQLKEKDHASSSAMKDLQDVNAKLVVVESQHQSRVKELEKSLQDSRHSLDDANKKVDGLVAEKKRLNETMSSLEGRAGEVKSLQSRLDEKENEINRLQGLLKESQHAKSEVESSLSRMMDEVKELQRKSNDENFVPKQHLEQKDQELKSISSERESLAREVSSLKKSLSILESQVSSVTSLVSKSLPETTSATLVASVETLLNSLQNQTPSQDSNELQSVRQQLEDQIEVNRKLERDIDSFKASLKSTVSTLFLANDDNDETNIFLFYRMVLSNKLKTRQEKNKRFGVNN